MSSIITPPATLSFPQLYSPAKVDPSDENEVPKYSCSLIFPADADLSELKQKVAETAIAEFGADAVAMLKDGRLKSPFIPGEKARAPEGTTVLRVRSTRKPGVVSRVMGPDERPLPITDPSEMYAGAQVRASLGVFAYNKKTNKGVSFGLNNIQKLGEGERLDGVVDARDEFDADPDMVADLGAMDDAASDATAGATADASAFADLL